LFDLNEGKHFSDKDFEGFILNNPALLLAGMNPVLFKGSCVEAEVENLEPSKLC
jgi:hypothetical protein